MYKAILKYGAENFTVEQIDIACSQDELNKKEIYWIKYFDSANKDKGYNLSLGGCIGNFNEEVRQKQREAQLGSKNSMYGKHHSAKTKTLFSIQRKGVRIGNKNPNAKKVKCLETGEIFDTLNDACKKLNVNITSLSSCLKGRLNRAGGYHWEYANNY